MTFDAQIKRMPLAFDPDTGREMSDRYSDHSQDIQTLIKGVAGSSPYLNRLLDREFDWVNKALGAPDQAANDEIESLRSEEHGDLGIRLRTAKRRIAVLTALADVSGVWPLLKTTGVLTRLADVALETALKSTIGKEIERGKLPGATMDDLPSLGGMTCLAMGKMGAHELNYSSDIDLICLFDETRFDPADYFDARASFVRATRRAMALLSDITGEGYVFRTDLRLRPDPAVTPVCMAMEAAERYYESLGRTWERAAYIKARSAVGDVAAGNKFLKTLTPFVWRKHLDFAAIKDAHDMRLRYREKKGAKNSEELAGHNIKLGQGGIRDIEFFTQTHQLIAGGRDPELRMRQTMDALLRLAQKDWISTEVASELSDHYVAHRDLEHRIQMINDAQTHDFPSSLEGRQRVACLSGVWLDTLVSDVNKRLSAVHELTEDFFAPDLVAADPAKASSDFDQDILDRWMTYPALRSERAVEIFERIQPDLLNRLSKTSRPEEALVALDGFLSGLPAGVQLFSLFEANPQLVDLLVDIVGTSPELGKYLSRNSSVFDAVIGGAFFADWPGVEALTEELAAMLVEETDYENKLDTTRRWAKEWHFRTGVHHLRGLIDARAAALQYTDLADAVLRALWPEVVDKFSEKHGPPPGNGAMILGMGSLGARRLNASSDLDLIVIYDAAGQDSSEGRRPLASRAYYARLTQAMVTALTAPMAQGRLYEVDMRLRPSGTQGPVATSLASFKDYQETQAWTWEHLALTRARPVAGSAELMEDIETFRRALLSQPHDGAKTRADVTEMRDRIENAKGKRGQWDTKIGRGRLQDIELTAQAASLLAGDASRDISASLRAGHHLGWLSEDDKTTLEEAYNAFWTLQTALRLLGTAEFDPAKAGAGGLAFLLRETGQPDIDALDKHLQDIAAKANAVITQALGREVNDAG